MHRQFTHTFYADGIPQAHWQFHDRGSFESKNNILTIADGWASAEIPRTDNYILEFSARAPEDAPQVQIWAGLRHFSRDYRYVAALRGGNNNHLYLARLGAEGYDKMPALRPLEWTPQPGIWYRMRIVCSGTAVAVYVNHFDKPLICVRDEDAPFQSGGISLGGSYLPAQYRDITVTRTDEHCLDGVSCAPDYLASVTPSPEEKERLRRRERASYRPFAVPALPEGRMELSLNGKWLFIPDYERSGENPLSGHDANGKTPVSEHDDNGKTPVSGHDDNGKTPVSGRDDNGKTPVSGHDAENRQLQLSSGHGFQRTDMPSEHGAGQDPLALGYDDNGAHVISVPASWIPLKAWLEGERMRDMNKGMNDNYLVEETTRCLNQTFDYKKTNSAWYRHYLDLPKGIQEKRVVLDFEGIALISAVYFNGVRVHENIGMFAPQEIDVSSHVREGRNLIAVEVHRKLTDESEHAVSTSTIDDNYATAWDILDAGIKDRAIETKCQRRPFCTNDIAHGFYGDNPGGIWRNVRLIVSDRIHVKECCFRPSLDEAEISVSYANLDCRPREVSLSYSLTHKTTGEFLCGGTVETAVLKNGETRAVSFTTPRVSPRLWGPGTPNLYLLKLTLSRGGEIIDTWQEQVGFRTVAFQGQTLMYNGRPMWVRGGNHMPAHVRPNDRLLAEKFMSLALQHNLMATRTHVAPWTSVWLDAADEAGLMVSFEGTWSWLMLEHIPSEQSIILWKKELLALMKRHRNRPSLFLMTMNNEMKFYLHEAPDEIVVEKGRILEGGIRIAREIMPHLPLVCDSAYFRKHAVNSGRYERIIQANGYDDGDMDDPHGYFGWYNPCFFHFMNGEFGRDYTTPGRPCMSQECATGYPRAEDGLPTRAYLFMHQTPQTTAGKKAYEHCDPWYFLSRHAMLTKELAEMFRRVEHDRTCGVLLFAFETWFYHQHDSLRIQPMLSAGRLKLAFQPVLASIELWGRHFYAGDTLSSAITLVNDLPQKECLIRPVAEISAVTADGLVLACTVAAFDDLPYFGTAAVNFSLTFPDALPGERVDARLTVKVRSEGNVVSVNEYDILLASAAWGRGNLPEDTWYYPSGDAVAEELLKRYGLAGQACGDLSSLPGKEGRLIVSTTPTAETSSLLQSFAAEGGNVILLNQKELPGCLLAGQTVSFREHRQEIITFNIPESSVFDGLEEADPAWFGDGRQVPYVAHGRYTTDRFSSDICVLAETLEWHGYINKPTDYRNFGGTPLFSVKTGKGHILVSALRTDAVSSDPVASRLTGNIMGWDFDMQK